MMVRERSKFLLCVNDSQHSLVALRFVCMMARRQNRPIQLLHVVEPVDPTFRAVAAKMREEKRQAAEKLLDRCAQDANALANIRPVLTVREGSVAEEIISTIEEDHTISMLVVATSHDSPTRDVLLPALTSQVGNRLLIPMLVIPGTLTEQQIEELS